MRMLSKLTISELIRSKVPRSLMHLMFLIEQRVRRASELALLLLLRAILLGFDFESELSRIELFHNRVLTIRPASQIDVATSIAAEWESDCRAPVLLWDSFSTHRAVGGSDHWFNSLNAFVFEVTSTHADIATSIASS